jgi:predicted negative regulator of RcsB-dependent stress response
MKSEQRHKLQQNALADWLAGVLKTIQPYANAVLAVVLLVVVVLGLWRWLQHQSTAAAAGAWESLYRAISSNDPAQLDRIVEQNQGTEVAYWAAVLSGDMHLSFGCRDLFTNKATASQDLRKAIEKYTLVRNESRTSALRERATFGLARAYEALGGTRQSEGELGKAVQSYEEVVKNWPNGTFTGAAQERLDDLNSKSAKTFYDKFAKFDPQPAFSTPPGAQGKPVFDSKSLPEDGSVPDFSKMMNEGTKKESAQPVKTGPAKVGQPAAEKPAAEAPIAPAPKDAKPDKPATDKK